MVADSGPPQVVYRPEVFEVNSLEEAKWITVTPEREISSEERWQRETPYHVTDFGKHVQLARDSYVLDYGCGVGRLAKALLDAFGCHVIGVDQSKSMRLLAPEYVLSERFAVWSPAILDKMTGQGFRFHAIACLWVIQHVGDPQRVIQRLADALAPGGILYCVNQETRSVPTNIGFLNDGLDMRKALQEAFEEIDFHRIPADVTSPRIAGTSMVQVLKKR